MHEITINLHMHTRYSDGSGLHKDIAAAAVGVSIFAWIIVLAVEASRFWQQVPS